MIDPHPMLSMITPDEIAECYDGVIVDGDESLYKALWALTAEMKPLQSQIDIENSCPGDAIGINNTASLFHKLDLGHQIWLNQVMVEAFETL